MCDVLVLDNDELIRVVTMVFLEDANFFVCEAANSADALAIMKAIPCSILLTDLKLGPDSSIRDGRDVAAAAMHLYPALSVIYTSGSVIDLGRPLTTRERALAKPYRPQRLIDAIRELLMARCSDVLTH